MDPQADPNLHKERYATRIDPWPWTDRYLYVNGARLSEYCSRQLNKDIENFQKELGTAVFS